MWLADGRRFWRKRRWHRFNGAEVAHRVESFRGERCSLILYNHPKVVGAQEKVQRVSEEPVSTGSVWCDTCEAPERVLAVKKSYRNVGKREKQEELFPALQKEIATRRLELH